MVWGYTFRIGKDIDERSFIRDFQYYHTMRMETEYAVNDDEVKQYFPLEKGSTDDEMMTSSAIGSDLFG